MYVHINVLSYTNSPPLLPPCPPHRYSSTDYPPFSTLTRPHPIPAEVKAQGYFTTKNGNMAEGQ